MSSLMSSYGRLPISMSHGEGVFVWDTDGKRYIDALGGIAVCALGHANAPLAAALADQAGKLLHTSNLYGIPVQEELGRELTAIAEMDNVFFCNSGAEANEACIKVARLHGNRKGIAEPAIVVMENSFHGRTLATLTATGNRNVQAGFEPLVPGFVRAPYSDLEALERIAQSNRNVVGVMLEPIQGEGGVQPAAQGYLKGVRDLCDQHDWLMIVDEIQTGMGRTGKWFAHQHEDIVPDVMALAKSLGNGVPIGACLAQGKAADLIQPGHHGSTFGGNFLACRAALSVIQQMQEHNLPARAAELGERMMDGFQKSIGADSGVVSIRGKGMMIGIELAHKCPELVTKGLEAGVLINVAAGNVVRLLPPYILTNDEADQIVDLVSGIINEFLTSKASAEPA